MRRHRPIAIRRLGMGALLCATLLMTLPPSGFGDEPAPPTEGVTEAAPVSDAGSVPTNDANQTPDGAAASDGAPNPEGSPAGDTAATTDEVIAAPDADNSDVGNGNGNDINFQQLPDSSFIYDTSISTLANADSYYNNQTVQVTGEVIGDRINAEFDPSHCWITLQATDGSNAQVIVFLTKDMTSGIDTYGAYGRKGTTLQVQGTYYLVCPQHEGVSDIHGDAVSVVSAGSAITVPFRWSLFIPGIILVIIGVALMAFYRYLQERER